MKPGPPLMRRRELYAKLAAARAEAGSGAKPRGLTEVMKNLRKSLGARRESRRGKTATRPRRTGAASAWPHGRRARR